MSDSIEDDTGAAPTAILPALMMATRAVSAFPSTRRAA